MSMRDIYTKDSSVAMESSTHMYPTNVSLQASLLESFAFASFPKYFATYPAFFAAEEMIKVHYSIKKCSVHQSSLTIQRISKLLHVILDEVVEFVSCPYRTHEDAHDDRDGDPYCNSGQSVMS